MHVNLVHVLKADQLWTPSVHASLHAVSQDLLQWKVLMQMKMYAV